MNLFYVLLILIFTQLLNAEENKDQELDRLRLKNKPTIQEFQRLIELETGKNLYENDGFKYYKRYTNFWANRLRDNKPDPVKLFEDFNTPSKIKDRRRLQSSQPRWEELGPFSPPIGSNGLGRVNVVRVHPNDPSRIFAGAASGGIWRSDDYGVSWRLLPGTDFLTMAISDIAISPIAPNIMYAATGDANTYLASPDEYSIGIIKSTDGGESWNMTNLAYTLNLQKLVGRVLVDPRNADYLIAGTVDGVFVSEDGGDTWENTASGNMFKDLEFHPEDPDIVYGSTASRSGSVGIYKSTDKGKSWTLKRSFDGALRAEIAVSPAAPDFVYAVGAQNSERNSELSGAFHSFIVSEDLGETWEISATYDEYPDILGNNPENSSNHQGFYDLCIAVNPQDEDEVEIGGVRLWYTSNGGNTWLYNDDFNRRNDNALGMHVDHHFAEFTSTGDSVWLGNDGGVWLMDLKNNAYHFRSEGMNITQFYKMDVSQQDINMMTGGCQDNGSFLALDNDTWDEIVGGDGMDNGINPQNDDYVYASWQNGNFRYSEDRGNRFQNMISSNILRNSYDSDESGAWVTPMDIDPINPRNIWVGYNNIWKNPNFGDRDSWEKKTDFSSTAEFEFIHVAKPRPQTIYAGHIGRLIASFNDGSTWESFSLPFGLITCVEANPNDDRDFFAGFSGYTPGQKVYKYLDGEWVNLSGNLPNVPVNALAYDEENDRLYAGTDIGVYYSDHGSGFWKRFGQDMPAIVISDIVIHENTRKIVISSYGRGLWSTDLLSCESGIIQTELSEELENNSLCAHDTVYISVVDPQPGLSYLWSTGEIGESIRLTESGFYSVTVESNEACQPVSEILNIEVLITDPITITSRPSTNVVCPGDSLRLNPGFGFEAFEWQDGSTDRYFYAKEAGLYWVRAYNDDGCYSYGEFEVLDKPVIDSLENSLRITGGEAYQWFFEGEPIEGANGDNYVPEESGNYQVEVTYDDCTIMSESFYFGVTNIEDYFAEFNVNPNPSNGTFQVTIPEDFNRDFRLQIVTQRGQIILSRNFKANEQRSLELDLSRYDNGVYFINLYSGSIKSTKKVIIQK